MRFADWFHLTPHAPWPTIAYPWVNLFATRRHFAGLINTPREPTNDDQSTQASFTWNEGEWKELRFVGVELPVMLASSRTGGPLGRGERLRKLMFQYDSPAESVKSADGINRKT
jgi:hypothetical protein